MSTPPPGPTPEDPEGRARRLADADRRSVWHPFTQMADWLAEEPLIIERAEGNYLIDVRGKRYLDGVSSLWVGVHGHGRPEIVAAIQSQAERLDHSTFLGLSNVPAVELAERLRELVPPGLTRVFYSDNGSTAVEIALKIAYQFWQQRGEPERRRFLSFQNGYHGDTLGAVSVGGIDLFHAVYRPLLFEARHVPSPYCYRCYLGKEYPSCGMACLGDVEEALAQQEGETAAVVIEPLVQAAGGFIVFPPGYTRRVRELAARYGALFIADEVATGFGRTGALFACELEGISPDLMTVAKGLTGGTLPLAATLATEEIFAGFLAPYAEQHTFFHGHTYTGNPIACAAALANLDVFETDQTLAQLQGKIALLTQSLAHLRDLAHVGDIRQLGFMVGIELVRDQQTKERYAYAERVGLRVCEEIRRRGVILRPLGDVIVLMPPLSITAEEIGQLVDATYEAIRLVTAEPAP